MLQRIAWLAIAAPRRIIAVAALVMVAAGIFGIPVAKSLSRRRIRRTRRSESARAAQDTDRQVRPGRRAAADRRLRAGRLHQRSGPRGRHRDRRSTRAGHRMSTSVTSAWTAPPAAAASLVSKDGKSGLIVAGIGAGRATLRTTPKRCRISSAHDRNGVTVRSGGLAMVNVQITEQSQHDCW